MAPSRSVTLTVDTAHLTGQLRGAVAIVEALAASAPYLLDEDDGHPYACAICGERFVSAPSPLQHADTCPFRLAGAWMAEATKARAAAAGLAAATPGCCPRCGGPLVQNYFEQDGGDGTITLVPGSRGCALEAGCPGITAPEA